MQEIKIGNNHTMILADTYGKNLLDVINKMSISDLMLCSRGLDRVLTRSFGTQGKESYWNVLDYLARHILAKLQFNINGLDRHD